MRRLLLLTTLVCALVSIKGQNPIQLLYQYNGTSNQCVCAYNSWCLANINCNPPLCTYQPSALDFRVTFQVSNPGGTIGPNPFRMKVDLLYNTSTVLRTAQWQGSTPVFNPLFLQVPIVAGQYNAKIYFEKLTLFGWKKVGTYLANTITMTFCPPCPTDVSINGFYSNALTESGTWIRSIGQTTIASTSSVVLDADPIMGFVLLAPSSSSDYFYSAPNASGKFVAQTLDGCGAGIPFAIVPDLVGDGVEIDAEQKAAPIPMPSSELKIYPNPSSGVFMLELPMEIENENGEVLVYNVEGVLVYQALIVNQRTKIDLADHPAGIYFATIRIKETVTSRKLVLQ